MEACRKATRSLISDWNRDCGMLNAACEGINEETETGEVCR